MPAIEHKASVCTHPCSPQPFARGVAKPFAAHINAMLCAIHRAPSHWRATSNAAKAPYGGIAGVYVAKTVGVPKLSLTCGKEGLSASVSESAIPVALVPGIRDITSSVSIIYNV